MATHAASVDAGSAAVAGDYPTLFASYVVRSAETLQRRLATGGTEDLEAGGRLAADKKENACQENQHAFASHRAPHSILAD